MRLIYTLLIHLHSYIMAVAAWFEPKAAKWVQGRKHWKLDLSQKINNHEQYIWIHCASAGEFEQAIPLIKKIGQEKPELKAAVSFFSPSGFDMYQDSELAAIFFYFPIDTRMHAESLLSLLNPAFVIFIKNEIWWNALMVLKEKSIPTYLVNANSGRKRNAFYQYYLDKVYPLFTKIFYVSAYGDTKLDKVIENKNTAFTDTILEDFCKDSLVIILGSSRKTEEALMALFYKQYSVRYPALKMIVAPHEYNESKCIELEKIFSDWQIPNAGEVIRYTDYQHTSNNRILFLDRKGILKFAYRYADIAFIGGGFGKSVHNMSEAAVYGLPTIFGPRYFKFEEVKELVRLKAAFPINDYAAFENRLQLLINDTTLRTDISTKLATYFSQQEKTAAKIISAILK